MNIEKNNIKLENKEALEKIFTTCIQLVSLANCDILAISITLHSTAGRVNNAIAGHEGQGILQYQEIVLDAPLKNTLTYVQRK
jgi:hypothetical protein